MEQANRDIEVRILALVRHKDNYFKYSKVLRPTFFSEPTKLIYVLIIDFFTRHDQAKLSTGNMKALIIPNLKDDDLKQEILGIIKVIRKTKVRDDKVTQGIVIDFAKRQLIRQAILEGITLLEQPNPDFNTLKEHIENALFMSCENGEDHYNYFHDPEDRIRKSMKEIRLPTLIAPLDEMLDGGMSPGELCVILGPPGRGKTLSLVNMGAAGLIQGLIVLHITLEISDKKVARCYDLRLSGQTFSTLRENPSHIKDHLKKLRDKGGDLVIKDYTATHPKIEDIKGFILNYQNRYHKKFDLMVVDYADLIRPSQRYKDSRCTYKK